MKLTKNQTAVLIGVIIVVAVIIGFIALGANALSSRFAVNAPQPTVSEPAATPTAPVIPTPELPEIPNLPTPELPTMPSIPPLPEAPSTGYDVNVIPSVVKDGTYDRDLFGSAWADVDNNGCDTRNDILKRDLVNITYLNSGNCKINTGVLNDPYTSTTIQFQYGPDTSREVQIDHIIPLGNAWYVGANSWDDAKRAQFANDPENLLAVDGSTNSSKSDKGPAQWMPANAAYTCTYSQKYLHIADKYDLSVVEADYNALMTGLTSCK